MNVSRHFLKTTGNFAYILSVAFIIAGLITNLMPVSASLAAPALPKSGSGAIWTTANDCGDESQDVNHYVTGEQVYINGAGFSPNTTYPWEIKGKPGGASGDPNIVVASGTITTDANGAFCFNAYTIPPDDWGEYQVKVSNKGDNYRVTQLPAASASVSVGSCTWSRETGSLTAVTLTLVGASLTINGNTYTTSTTIYLPPGTYPYTWTAQSGYYGSGSGSVTVGSCVPGEASATIEIGTCSWDEENGSLTAVTLTLVGASLTIGGETYTASQTIYLPPGTYAYSWEAQPGYIGSGSGEITIGSCAPGEASASIVVGTCNWDEENGSLTEVAITLVGASFTINDSTYTTSTVIYLPPGTYTYTWEAQSGYIGSGSGELNIDSCAPEDASASIAIGTCTWNAKDGSLTEVVLTLVGAALTINGNTFTETTTIYLPPGTYAYSWEAQIGYIGSGSGEITIGSCAPEEASVWIVIGTCNWNEDDGSLTEVAITLVGASLTINDSTYTTSTVIYLPPGTYTYTWEAQSGYIGSGSGELNIGSCEPEPALPDLVAELQCYTLEELGFIFVISNEGESGEIGYSTDINTTIVSLGILESDEITGVLIPSSASMLYLYVRNGDAWEEAEAIALNKEEVPVCENPLELEAFCSYVDLSKPFGWTLRNANPFPVTFTWVYGEESSPEPILLAAGSSLTFATTIQDGETMQIFVDGILMASSPGPESCPAFQPLELVGVCSTDPAIAHGWIAYNPNSIEVNAEWKVVGGTLAGLLTIPAESAVGFTTPVSAGDSVALYYSGILQDTAMAATGCLPGGGDEPGGGGEPPAGQPPAGQPPVTIGPAQAFQPPLIPVTGGEVPVIIPVTGVDLNAPAFSGMGFFALSLVCFGFGMVLNGLSRRRIED